MPRTRGEGKARDERYSENKSQVIIHIMLKEGTLGSHKLSIFPSVSFV